MRGGFGRNRYERPQPGQQIHSYDDALYPPRAYRYHVQQATAPALTAPTRSNAQGEPLAHAIVLPTIDADAACGPFLKGAGGGSSSSSGVATSGNVSGSVSASSMSFMGRSASAASNVTDGMGFYPMDAERRPPPRLRVYFDCFVPDEEGSDVQTFSEVCRHAEPLNPFHYRELWAGMAGELTTATATATTAVTPSNAAVAAGAGPVKKERVDESGDVTAGNGSRVDTSAASKEESAKPSAATRAATRAAQTALQRTLRALGVPDELGSMVLLAARVPAGGRLTRKQEKMLRLRPQRRPAPPRPIRRGAKVFLPAYALLASGEAQGSAEVEAMAVTGGLIDVTAAGPRVLRVAEAAARQRGVFGTVGGGDGFEYGKSVAAGAAPASAASAVLNEFAFDDEDDEDGMGGGGGRAGRRAGGRRGRGEEDGLAEGDIPLIALGRWSQAGGASNGVGGAASGGGAGLNGTGAVASAGQLDEEAEEDSDEEDDMSTGMAEDDDDDANFSSDGGNDNDSFGGGGDDGNDDY